MQLLCLFPAFKKKGHHLSEMSTRTRNMNTVE